MWAPWARDLRAEQCLTKGATRPRRVQFDRSSSSPSHLSNSPLLPSSYPASATNMPPKAPPLNARPFLNDPQKAELATVPAPYQKVGAWLILIRDDHSDEWEERPTRCIECTGQGVPCIDKVNRGKKRRKCESCFPSEMKCSPGYEPDTTANDVVDLTGSTQKKRRLEKTSKSTLPKNPKRAERASPAASSVSKRVKASQFLNDRTADGGRPRKTSKLWNLPARKQQAVVSPRPASLASSDGITGSEDSDSGEERSDSEGEPPQLRMPRRTRSPPRAPRSMMNKQRGAHISQTRPPTPSKTPASSRESSHFSQYPPVVGSVKTKGGGQDDGPVSAINSSLSTTPHASTPSARLRFYHNDRIRALLYKARQTMQPRIAVIVDLQERAFSKSTMSQYDFTVSVSTPTCAGTSTWLVTVIDHENRRGRVLFNANGPGGYASQAEKDAYVRFILEKAFDTFRGVATMEGVNYPCLEDVAGGSFYATTLAVACVRNLPALPLRDIVIDDEKATVEHSTLLDNVPMPPMSTALGPSSPVVGRISRHDGRLRLA